MGFSISLPTIGQPNSTEDVKVNNSLTAIQTWGNGNILGSDLSPTAAIARSQMAGSFGNLAFTPVATNTSCVDGSLYYVSAASTMTLPTATLNRTIGVTNGIGAGGVVTITAGSGVILGVGLGAGGVSSITLGTAYAAVVLVGGGTNWAIVSGQQDTGWIAPSFVNAGVVQTVPLKCRLVADSVELSGTATWGSLSGGTILTLPAGFPAPTSAKDWICATASDTHVKMAASSTNLTNTNSTGQAFLDVVRYRVGS